MLHEAAETAPASVPQKEQFGDAWAVRQRQDGLVSVPLHLPLGFVPAGEFARIGDIAAKFSEEQGPRTMRSQNLVIRSVKIDDLPALMAELQTLETDVVAPVALERFVACAGASTCRLGLCLARGAARACADALDASDVSPDTLNTMEVYINGCPNACGHQPIGPIGLSGAARRSEGRLVPAYRVTLGGRCDVTGARLGAAAGEVPARALPDLMRAFALDFEANRRNDETFSDYFDRTDKAHLGEIVAGYAATPSHDEQPDFYRDFGADEEFSLAGRGAGECGSGVFEVIQADLAAARKATEPFDILLPAARALLITRGVDVQDPDSVLREFEAQFVDTGLVAEEFSALLTRARGYIQGWQDAFDGYEDYVSSLLERVELLYSTLDGNLAFHPPEDSDGGQPMLQAPETAQASRQAVVDDEQAAAPLANVPELDLRGVACPMNFVKAKLRLETMDVGSSLAIVLDAGEPVQNVPASLKGEGQEIVETTDLEDGHWRIVVKKNSE